ncbi:hypothetical protein CRG98_021725 [Punica granatum]|uniref:Secreted protein n=1 Tax=Punica granatum TaxID=22663 RepID=A0A2I0JQY3_PUNGR|nr:hypothetical protein CRG98_021725 [Punica granatum]
MHRRIALWIVGCSSACSAGLRDTQALTWWTYRKHERLRGGFARTRRLPGGRCRVFESLLGGFARCTGACPMSCMMHCIMKWCMLNEKGVPHRRAPPSSKYKERVRDKFSGKPELAHRSSPGANVPL